MKEKTIFKDKVVSCRKAEAKKKRIHRKLIARVQKCKKKIKKNGQRAPKGKKRRGSQRVSALLEKNDLSKRKRLWLGQTISSGHRRSSA